jgi:glycyl-tRNA synthetase
MTNQNKPNAKAREELMQYISEKGMVYGPSPEIYDGGISGFYDFGPLGKSLKNAIENTIRSVFDRFEFNEVECPIVVPKKVWKASGHIDGINDPIVKCEKCASIFRIDNLIEEQNPDVNTESMTIKDMEKFLTEHEVNCPNCKKRLPSKITEHNLMLKTQVGLDIEMYNRPETATTTYLPFLNYLRHFRDKLPFGVYQIGNAYRNEISPRQHLIRGREFTQAEAQLFLFKDQKENFEKFDEVQNLKLPFLTANAQKGDKEIKTMSLKDAIKNKVLKNKAYAWTLGMTYQLFQELGIPKERLRYLQHLPEKLAFYADDAWDLEVYFDSFGWVECCGCHDRTDYDLKTHSKFSGKELVARNINNNNEKETPHILEIAIGPNRLLLAVLDIFYEKSHEKDGKTKLKIPAKLAPNKVAIMPLIKKEHLESKAKEIFNELIKDYKVQMDVTGSIGKRYLRQDSIGTPFCITIDFDGLEEDNENFGTVTIRHRDSEKQERVKFEDIKKWLNERI